MGGEKYEQEQNEKKQPAKNTLEEKEIIFGLSMPNITQIFLLTYLFF